jgi:hypothetical protein
MRLLLPTAAVAVAFAFSTSVSAGERSVATKPGPPTRADAWIGRLVVKTAVRSRPAGRIVATIGPWSGGPVGLLVLNSRRGPLGATWLKVRLPRRPNGASGWISADAVQLRRTAYRIEISTGRRQVRLRYKGRVIQTYGAVVGRPGTPTPRGLFAVAQRVRQLDPNGFLGPWALLLTAHSDALARFDGGPGTVAIHGRAGASLRDPLGSARSHGCIRIDNNAVSLLAGVAREGTPVLITG